MIFKCHKFIFYSWKNTDNIKWLKCSILGKNVSLVWIWWRKYISKSWDVAMFTTQSGNWGEQLLDCWERNAVPSLFGSSWLISPGSSSSHFSFHDESKCFGLVKGRDCRQASSALWMPLLLSHAVVLAVEIYTAFSEEDIIGWDI